MCIELKVKRSRSLRTYYTLYVITRDLFELQIFLILSLLE